MNLINESENDWIDFENAMEIDDDVAQYPEDPPLWLGAGIGRGPECDDRDRND